MADKRYGKHKDLRVVFDIFQLQHMNNCNTVIIDDHPKVYSANGLNTIPAPAFLVMDEKTLTPNESAVNDIFLLQTIEKLEGMKQNFDITGCI